LLNFLDDSKNHEEARSLGLLPPVAVSTSVDDKVTNKSGSAVADPVAK